ncbi:cyclase family protein [Aeromicrobium sp. Leaf350]|uniref:cyclase family protein n=1 Tax=Aeromicrobium sp. Leaf350 TaxID=2876565 RepID=UPI001E47AB98|nr:cyclase family protein [Aeromicrobium sp. Leaf350]
MASINAAGPALPRYDDLPLVDGTDLRHAWDVFGRGDSLGTLNHLTDERRLAALGCARTGRTVSLTLPLDRPHAPPFGRDPLVHRLYQANGFSWGDRIEHLDLQGSSQWDGLLHVLHKEVGFYGGHRGEPADAPQLGIDAWARTGIVGRGVLLDVGAYLDARGERDALGGRAVTAQELAEVADLQGTELREGDVLCVRFGWHTAFAALDRDAGVGLMARPRTNGLSAEPATAAFLWDHRVAAVVSDNPTVEVQPGDPAAGFLHHRLITMLGMPLGELFDLDELAEACAAAGTWDFLFAAVPLNLPGGVGSPANAVAVL